MSDHWFKPRRYGFGATPSTWQGWLVIAVFVVAMVGTSAALMGPPQPRVGLFILAVLAETLALVEFCRRKTDGDWRWRWGKD